MDIENDLASTKFWEDLDFDVRLEMPWVFR